MRDYFCIGPTPSEEDCAQVGQPGYHRKAIAECSRFIQLIRETLGPEPAGAELTIKSFPHDFGTYYEVVVWFEPDDAAAVAYAERCDNDTPRTWGDTPAASLKTCPSCGYVLEVLLFMGVQPDGYVCPACQMHYTDDLTPGAKVIGGEGERIERPSGLDNGGPA